MKSATFVAQAARRPNESADEKKDRKGAVKEAKVSMAHKSDPWDNER